MMHTLRAWTRAIFSALNAQRSRIQRRERVLTHDILSLQLVITAVIGAIAIAGLYVGGQWILQDNYSRWAMQWTEELNELGAPLYLPNNEEVQFRLQGFIEKYPEITRVTYYREDGAVMHSVLNGQAPTVQNGPVLNAVLNGQAQTGSQIGQAQTGQVPNAPNGVLNGQALTSQIGQAQTGQAPNAPNGQPQTGQAPNLDDETTRSLADLVRADTPYLIESGFANAREFEILAPVWTESIERDGMFDFDPTADSNRMSVNLIGFVGVDLDFIPFHNRLLTNIKIAISLLLALLVASGFLARRMLLRALSAISDLQKPIAEIAKGNLSVEFQPAEHREIKAIVHALETTASALGERNARLVQLANQDVLTGLLNRRRFVAEVEHEIHDVADGKLTSALLFIDLDQFKHVNDTCGHPAGDRLIRKVADQLKRSVNEQGIVARFGGDEFAVLVPGVNKTQAKKLAEKILQDMRRLAHIEDNNVFHVQCSMGIAMIDDGSQDTDRIIAQADIACREAKSGGRNRFGFYNMSDQEAKKVVADVGWMSRIREAIDADLFMLRYQPIVEISTGKVQHHEVLLRLRGDNGKTIAPEAFLPAAMRFGLMAEVDAWLVEHAIAALAQFRKSRPALRFSFNLSADAFERPDFAVYVQATLEKYDVAPDAIIIEIAESLAVRQLSYVDSQIATLRQLGCEVALDNFGAGYSSFTFLQKQKMTYVKIDGSFIRDIAKNPIDRKMVRLIGEIAHEAGIQAIAEYVPNAKALSLLGELGIDFAQGYYIGRPLATPSKKSLPATLNTKNGKRSARARA